MSVEIVSSAGNELAAAQRKEFRAAFLSVAPAMILGSLDQTIIAAALPVDSVISPGSLQAICRQQPLFRRSTL